MYGADFPVPLDYLASKSIPTFSKCTRRRRKASGSKDLLLFGPADFPRAVATQSRASRLCLERTKWPFLNHRLAAHLPLSPLDQLPAKVFALRFERSFGRKYRIENFPVPSVNVPPAETKRLSALSPCHRNLHSRPNDGSKVAKRSIQVTPPPISESSYLGRWVPPSMNPS